MALVALGLSACEGKDTPPAPRTGQATLLPAFAPDSRVGRALGDPLSPPHGFYTADSGESYVLNFPSLVRLGTDGKAVTVPFADDQYGGNTPAGVIAMPDGSVLIGSNGEVLRFDREGIRSVLAGTADAKRPLNQAAPAKATATRVRFTESIAPIGVTRTGAVIIADDRALWSLANGQLTLVYQRPTAPHGKDYGIYGDGDTVAPDGTTYLRPASSSQHTLAEVQVISPDGTAAPLKLPAALPGIAGPLATLTPLWMSSDGADGLYVHAQRLTSGGDYILHIRNDKATLVAVGTISGNPSANGSCSISKPVDAKHFPCPLPWALGYHAGRLTLAGAKPYAVEVLVDKP
ncbi:hypothetical protein ACWD4N_03280 [Streptomyces sp. NPDC002586]